MPLSPQSESSKSLNQNSFDVVSFATLATPQSANCLKDDVPGDENPYASPASDAQLAQTIESSKDKPLTVAKLKRINRLLTCSGFCFIAYIGSLILFWNTGPENAEPLIHGLLIAFSGFAFWIVLVLLAYNAYHLFGSILTGILLNVPLVNLFVYMTIRDRASKLLKSHGFKKGLLQLTFDQAAYDEFANNQSHGLASNVAIGPTCKESEPSQAESGAPKRSSTSTVFTYVLIGLLVGFVLISALASMGSQ